MNIKKACIGVAGIVMIFLMLSLVLSQSVHYSGLPKVDEILYKAYPAAPPDVIVDEFLAKVTDWIGGPGRKDLYDMVVGAGHKVSSMDPMAEFGFMPINCRDYKETSGEVNFPLNDSAFRLALSYIYGMDDKQADIYAYVQAPWTYALGNPVPPAQEPWYDDTVVMPNTDKDYAWTLLTGAGYYLDGDNHLAWNGVKLRNLEVKYSTGALYWSEGPGGGFVTAFNEFISYIGATGPTMTLLPTNLGTLVTELTLTHDFDFICTYLTDLGVYVDWLYDLLHSDNDLPWGRNFCGIHDDDFDTWTEIILTSLDVNEIIDAASLVQAKFVYELMPWFPMSTGLEFCTSANDERGELMNIISMPNYGPRNDLSWMAMHWKGEPDSVWPGGTVATALGDEPTTLNPYTEETPYGWQFLDRTIQNLLMRNPIDLTTMPWIATDYEIIHWTSIPELGIVDGSMATFYLRQDVTWHDGKPVTAYDCVNNMRIMRSYMPGRYSSKWANLVYEEPDGPYKFTVYFYKPSLYYAHYVAETALLAPKHITDLVEKQVEDGILATFFDWAPADNDYSDLTGEAPPTKYPFMKQVVGCGPFVYDYYDRSLAVGRVAKYEEFFVNAPAIGAVVGEWRVEPETAYPYEVLVQNIAAKEDSPEGELTSITVDVKIYEDDVLTHTVTGITLDPWESLYLGPYTTNPLGIGEHTIKVEISGSLIHTYTHKLVATIREDINTYSGEMLDFMVDIKDILTVALANGSCPGHPRWNPNADINDDYFVDSKDYLAVALKYGWPGPTVTHDIAVTDLLACYGATLIAEGMDVCVNVTVTNKGGETETFTLTAYWNTTNVIDTTGVTLASGETKNVTLSWDTTGHQEYADYTLSAYATPVLGETNTGDNTFVDGTVFMVHMGDVTNDHKVDITDIFAIALAYGSHYGEPKYNPNLDINCDGKIDITDIFAAALNYGWK
jgi:ABC-type transport system substrate-binding protein